MIHLVRITHRDVELVEGATDEREAALEAFRSIFQNRGTEVEVYELGEPSARFKVTHRDVELVEEVPKP